MKRTGVTEKVRAYIATCLGTFSVTDVQETTGLTSQQVRSCLKDLRRKGDVLRIKKGVYASSAMMPQRQEATETERMEAIYAADPEVTVDKLAQLAGVSIFEAGEFLNSKFIKGVDAIMAEDGLERDEPIHEKDGSVTLSYKIPETETIELEEIPEPEHAEATKRTRMEAITAAVQEMTTAKVDGMTHIINGIEGFANGLLMIAKELRGW